MMLVFVRLSIQCSQWINSRHWMTWQCSSSKRICGFFLYWMLKFYDTVCSGDVVFLFCYCFFLFLLFSFWLSEENNTDLDSSFGFGVRHSKNVRTGDTNDWRHKELEAQKTKGNIGLEVRRISDNKGLEAQTIVGNNGQENERSEETRD